MPETSVTLAANVPPPGEMPRRVQSAIREVAAAEAEFHHQKHYPLHFRFGAKNRYGYKPLSPGYARAKQRKVGRRPRLVFSGRTRQEVLEGRRIVATATRGAKLVTRASLPGLSGRVRLKRGQRFLSRAQENVLRLRSEITAVRTDELQAVGEHGQKTYDEYLQTRVIRRVPRKLV